MRLDNVGVAVRDVAGARRFYADQLGLAVDGEGDSFAVNAGGTSFYVFRAGPADRVRAVDPELQASGAGFDHLSFAVDDVDATYEDLVARGVRFLAPPRSRDDWGLRVAPFVDPEGNLYFLICRL